VKDLFKRALLWAVAIEATNLFFLSFPLEGYSPDTPWYWKALGYQWLVLHYPGLLLLNHLPETAASFYLALFITGYLDTALLLLGIYWLQRVFITKYRPRADQI